MSYLIRFFGIVICFFVVIITEAKDDATQCSGGCFKNQVEQALILLPNFNADINPNWYKVQTYQTLAQLGCPVLRSALLVNYKALNENNLEILKNHLRSNVCSLRFQYKVPCPNPVRGGNKVELKKDILKKLWLENAVLWPVEHADRIKNKYGINILYQPTAKKIIFEIVGQGFDGTDLNKGDISPHQVIKLNLPEDRGIYGYIWHQASTFIISSNEYKKSIKLRLKKLKHIGVNMSVVKIPEQFTCLPFYMLEKLDYYACKVFSHFGYKCEINISATILDDNRIIFWDFQTPDNKSAAFFNMKKVKSNG